MFGLFAPKCPLETSLKTWTERRMRWLADTLGIERLRKAKVILPDDQYFPGEYRGTPDDAGRMFDLLCGWMGLNPASLSLEIVPDVQLPGAAGHYDQGTIRIQASELQVPLSLVATLAHELSHEILLGGGLLTPETPDHEWVTDLLPVYLGLGLFTANSTLTDRTINYGGNMSRWEMQRHGYLSSSVLGYAFALFAWMRGEGPSEWGRHLRPDARDSYDKGLRYLRKSPDVLFHPDTIREPLKAPTPTALRRRLEEGSPTLQLNTLWDIREQPFGDDGLLHAVVECLDHKDDAVVIGAADVLGHWRGDPAEATIERLLDLTASGSAEVRAAAATALGNLRQQPERVVPELAVLLTYNNARVRKAAVEAICQFEAEARHASRRLAAALVDALVRCDLESSELLADTLAMIFEAAPELFDECFEKSNPEIRYLAEAAIRDSSRRKRRAERTVDSG